MAVRFRNEHTSWAASSPITWKIEIFDSDHVGAVTDFEVEDGATIDYRADGDDVLAPILASNLAFSMVIEDATHEALITDLAGAEEGRFTVVLYKDSVFHWAGVINAPTIDFEDADYSYGFKIAAVDGLALLKNYPCSDNVSSSDKWTDVYEGQSKLATVISRCLKKLPHVVTHFTGSSKFLVTAINWYSDLHADPATDVYDPFWYTYIDNRAFADGQASGAAKFISCYDAISAILTCFNARIALYDGYFLVEQIEHRAATIGAPANYSRYYDYALTAPTANTLTADQDVGGSNAIKKLRGGSYSFLAALRKVRTTQRLNALQNLIPAFISSSDSPTTGYLAGTVKGDGLSTLVRFTGNIEFTVSNTSIAATNTLGGLFKLRIQLGSDTLLREVTWIGANVFSYSTVTWDADTASRIDIAVPIDRPDTGESQTVLFPVDFMFLTNIGFTSGDLTVDFDFEELRYLIDGALVGSGDYTEAWALKDAYCLIQNSFSPFSAQSVTYNVAGNADNTQELSLATITGDKDENLVNQWGGLLFFDDPDYNYTSLWGNRDGTRDRPALQLLAQRVMQMQYYPRKVLRGTVVGSALVVQDPITENAETYILKNGAYSTHRDELAGEWVKLAFASESLTYAPAEYDTGGYEATSPNGGSSGSGTTPDTGGGTVVGTDGIGISSVVQGDILYGSTTNVLSALSKSTSATRYLSNTGGSNNPAWAQVDLSNGVTGALPFANIGTIATQKLLGRYSSGTGVIEQITISTGLALDGSGNLTASGSGGTVTSVGVSGGTTGMSFSSSPVTTSGTMTMSGTLVAANGGTGQSTYTVGDILYASAATTLTKLNSGTAGTFLRSAGAASPVAWSGTTWPNSAITGDVLYASAANTYNALAGVATGNALISGGVSTAPSWGKIGLTTHVSGELPVANGGTGAATFTAGHILYGNGTSALTTSAALMYTSSVLRVQNTSTGTSVLGTAADEAIRLQNTSNTNNNWSWLTSYTQAGIPDAGIGVQHIDHSTREAAINIHAYGGGGFQRIARFQNTGITLDKAVTASSTLAVTGNSTFTGSTTHNGGLIVNTVAPVINTNLSIGSSSVGSLLTVWNDYSSTGAAGAAAWANILLKNRNGTANNWSAIEWDSNTNAIVADIAVQYLDHTADTGDIAFHTRGASTGFGEAFRVTSEKLVGIGVFSSLPARLTVRGTGATSATAAAVFENSSGTDILFVRNDGKVSIGNSSPQQTFHVTGTMRLTGSDGTATALMGRDADGDISAMAISSDMAITAGTLGLVDSTLIAPTQITSNQNNYNPTGLSTAGAMTIFADSSFRQITGIAAPSTAKRLTVINSGNNSILFPRESASSSAANRIRMSRDFVLLPGKTAIFFYDTSATKWRILSVGDSYSDLSHLWFDTQLTAPVTSVGDHHWQYLSDGSDYVIAPTAGRWSGHDLDTGTTTSGIGTLKTFSPLFESSTTAAQGVWAYFRAHIKTPSAVSDGTDTYLVKAGFVDSVSGGAVNGIYFSYDIATFSTLYAITRASGTATSTNTGTAFGADTVHLLELVYRPDGTVEFWLNGVSVATHSTNVPLTDLYSQIIIQKTAGTTARRLTWYAAQTTLARVS